MRTRAALIPAAAIALIAGAATITATTTTAHANNLNAAPAIGAMAPEFAFKDPEGETHALKDYRGKVVVLDFWATWCGPCRKVMPQMQELHEQYEDQGVVVIGMNVNENKDAAAFMKEQGYDYKLLLNAESSIQDYGVRGIPAFFVIAPDGKLAWSGSGSGANTHKNLVRAVKRELAKIPS